MALDVASTESTPIDTQGEGTGTTPYPHRFDLTHTAAEVRAAFGHLASGELSDEVVATAGRVTAVRPHARSAFFDLEDLSGRVQACLRAGSAVPGDATIRPPGVGDLVGVIGPVFRTRTGELTVLAERHEVLAPCLRPLPDRRHGVKDPGLQRGRRHLDLLANAESRGRFLLRSRIIRLLRELLWARGFHEVETAILDDAYGGAEARPFITGCHAVGRELYLRISPELPLKRLLVGGLERVFEIGKQFRNEGIDARHHPEFTSIEVYQAYADYADMMALTEEVFHHLAGSLLGRSTIVSRLNGMETTVDLTPPFRRLTVLEAIRTYTGADFADLGDAAACALAEGLGVELGSGATADEAVMAVFEAGVERHLIQPTFILDYPAALCPLTKRHRADPRLAERFELYIHGLEFANAYSELNDPAEQRRHFDAQGQKRAGGDELAHLPDYEFAEALEYGMPPAGGLGIGIDRLVMLLTGASHIQDVILFPLRGA